MKRRYTYYVTTIDTPPSGDWGSAGYPADDINEAKSIARWQHQDVAAFVRRVAESHPEYWGTIVETTIVTKCADCNGNGTILVLRDGHWDYDACPHRAPHRRETAYRREVVTA